MELFKNFRFYDKTGMGKIPFYYFFINLVDHLCSCHLGINSLYLKNRCFAENAIKYLLRQPFFNLLIWNVGNTSFIKSPNENHTIKIQ